MRFALPFRLAAPVLALALAAAAAVAVQAAGRDRLEAFLQVTGFDVALDSIALSAADAPAMLGMQAGDFGADWSRVADEVFDRERMHAMALDILEANLGDDLLLHAAEFYASPLGQRLVAAENASHLVEDDDAKRAEGRALVARGVAEGDPRIQVLGALNTAVDGAGIAVRAVQEIQVRFLMAAARSGVVDGLPDEATLRALLKQNEAELRRDLQLSALAAAAYTYRDFPLAELETYLAALERPEMQRVYELMNAVQYEIMANRFEVLAARMADMHPGQDL